MKKTIAYDRVRICAAHVNTLRSVEEMENKHPGAAVGCSRAAEYWVELKCSLGRY